LSRACLGKMIILSIKWRREKRAGRFLTWRPVRRPSTKDVRPRSSNAVYMYVYQS
jgi:hypothetical protein